MSRFDSILIEKIYTPLVGWVNARAGVDQWRLSIECLNGAIVFYLAGLALTIAGKGLADGILGDLVSAFLWLCVMQFVRTVALRQAGSSLGRQTARLQESIFRHLLVAILPLSLYYVRGLDNFCHSMSLVLLISHFYFKACDMPPPRRRASRRLAHAHG